MRALLLAGLAGPWAWGGCARGSPAGPGGVDLPLRYVAIDIDDVFQPNWDSERFQVGTVKMDASDVAALARLSQKIRRDSTRFRFMLGYNSAFFDSTNSGDRAFLAQASEFAWFNHLPRHDQVVTDAIAGAALDKLFAAGSQFEAAHGLTACRAPYLVTPRQEGIWPPYEPLYDAFLRHGVTCSSTSTLPQATVHRTVQIGHRTNLALRGDQYLLAQVGEAQLAEGAQAAYDSVAVGRSVVFRVHQANFARDRLANTLIAQLLQRLAEQDSFRVEFVPATEAVARQIEASQPPAGAAG